MNRTRNKSQEDDLKIAYELVNGLRKRSYRVFDSERRIVNQIIEFKNEKERLNQIKSEIKEFKRDFGRNLHLIESSSQAEREVIDISSDFDVSKEEVIERLLKISINNMEIQKELAADLFVDNEIDSSVAQKYLDERQIKNLKITRGQESNVYS